MTDAVFGHPWHGIINIGTGQLTTNAGPVVSAVGTLPLDDFTGRGRGKVMTVKVPGIPAAVTPLESQALGWQFLDYAILSGGENRLYGFNIGSRRWIYVAPDGSPWLADFGIALSADVAPPGFTGNLTVNLYRFGQFDAPDLERTVTVSGLSFPMSSAEVTLGFSAIPKNDAEIYLNDISSDGSKALFSICQARSGDFQPAVLHYYFFEVVLSGNNPAFEMTATVLKRPSDVAQQSTSGDQWHQWWDYDSGTTQWTLVKEDIDEQAAPPPFQWDIHQTTLYNSTSSLNVIMAAHYDVAGSLVWWSFSTAMTRTSSGSISPVNGSMSYASEYSSSESCALQLKKNGVVQWSITGSSTHAGNSNQSGGSAAGTYSIGDVSGTHGVFAYLPGESAGPQFRLGIFGPSIASRGVGIAAGIDSGTRFYPYRYTNTLVGIVKMTAAGSTLLDAWGKWGATSTPVDGVNFYGTENPVTGSITRSASAVACV